MPYSYIRGQQGSDLNSFSNDYPCESTWAIHCLCLRCLSASHIRLASVVQAVQIRSPRSKTGVSGLSPCSAVFLYSSRYFVFPRERQQFHCLHSEHSTAPRSDGGRRASYICDCIFLRVCSPADLHTSRVLRLGTEVPRKFFFF